MTKKELKDRVEELLVLYRTVTLASDNPERSADWVENLWGQFGKTRDKLMVDLELAMHLEGES